MVRGTLSIASKDGKRALGGGWKNDGNVKK
jgi:hypothetical protein